MVLEDDVFEPLTDAADLVALYLDRMDHPRFIASYCFENYVPSEGRGTQRVSWRNRRFTNLGKNRFTGEYFEYRGPGPKVPPKAAAGSSKKRRTTRR